MLNSVNIMQLLKLLVGPHTRMDFLHQVEVLQIGVSNSGIHSLSSLFTVLTLDLKSAT